MTGIIGIDPSLSNAGAALIFSNTIGEKLTYKTKHLTDVKPGDFSGVVREFQSITKVKYGFVEDFSTMAFQEGSQPKTIASVNYSGALATEAIAACGIPVIPISIHQWRRWTLGTPPKTATKSGALRAYWTKGEKKFGVPDNVTPALLRFFKDKLQIADMINGQKLFPKQAWEALTFDQAVDAISATLISSRRCQIAFGYSTDELEALAIAYAGLRLDQMGQIEIEAGASNGKANNAE